ncbi:hypothetical protein Tco_0691604 [Tanacetum coccineum]
MASLAADRIRYPAVVYCDMALFVLIMETLALVRNFIMPWAIDGTAPSARILGLPRIPLYCEGDLTTSVDRGRTFLPQDCTMMMAAPLSFGATTAFFTVLLVLALLLPCLISLTKCASFSDFITASSIVFQVAPPLGVGGKSHFLASILSITLESLCRWREAVTPFVS